jgi:hypothetical protein
MWWADVNAFLLRTLFYLATVPVSSRLKSGHYKQQQKHLSRVTNPHHATVFTQLTATRDAFWNKTGNRNPSVEYCHEELCHRGIRHHRVSGSSDLGTMKMATVFSARNATRACKNLVTLSLFYFFITMAICVRRALKAKNTELASITELSVHSSQCEMSQEGVYFQFQWFANILWISSLLLSVNSQMVIMISVVNMEVGAEYAIWMQVLWHHS